jgi:hypothetical protein
MTTDKGKGDASIPRVVERRTAAENLGPRRRHPAIADRPCEFSSPMRADRPPRPRWSLRVAGIEFAQPEAGTFSLAT